MQKQCAICKIVKYLDEFHKNPKSKDGKQSKCKDCANAYAREHRKLPEQKEKRKIYDDKYYKENKEAILERKAGHYEDNKEKKLKWQYNYYNTHKEERKIYNIEYREENKDQLSMKQKEYYQETKKERNEYNKSYNKERYANEPEFKLRRIMSVSVAQMLKAKGSSKEGQSVLQFLSYTVEELRLHIENLFEPWMNWNNHGKYDHTTWNDDDPFTWTWQLDHIIPHSTFNYTSMQCEEFRKCWALENLRPLSAKQNWLDGINRTRHQSKIK